MLNLIKINLCKIIIATKRHYLILEFAYYKMRPEFEMQLIFTENLNDL